MDLNALASIFYTHGLPVLMLGIAVYILWQENKDIKEKIIGYLEDKIKSGLVAQDQNEEYLKTLDVLVTEVKALRKDM